VVIILIFILSTSNAMTNSKESTSDSMTNLQTSTQILMDDLYYSGCLSRTNMIKYFLNLKNLILKQGKITVNQDCPESPPETIYTYKKDRLILEYEQIFILDTPKYFEKIIIKDDNIFYWFYKDENIYGLQIKETKVLEQLQEYEKSKKHFCSMLLNLRI
jgi:hypothetical protein